MRDDCASIPNPASDASEAPFPPLEEAVDEHACAATELKIGQAISAATDHPRVPSILTKHATSRLDLMPGQSYGANVSNRANDIPRENLDFTSDPRIMVSVLSLFREVTPLQA